MRALAIAQPESARAVPGRGSEGQVGGRNYLIGSLRWMNELGVDVGPLALEQVRPVQLVLLAMGFLGPEQPLLESLGIERDARSNVKAEFEKYSTSTIEGL